MRDCVWGLCQLWQEKTFRPVFSPTPQRAGIEPDKKALSEALTVLVDKKINSVAEFIFGKAFAVLTVLYFLQFCTYY